MTPLERAARTIWDGFGKPDGGWERFIPTAQNTLLAIREPSEGMREAARLASYQNEPFGPGAVAYWQAMIDAILEGE